MEALIFILGMVVLVESAAIVVLWNESSGRKLQIIKLFKQLDYAKRENDLLGKTIQELKELIRQLRKNKNLAN
jgi:hypothetical protein